MTSFINIQVRILAQQAMRQVQQMQNQMNGLGGTFGRANQASQSFRNSLGSAGASATRFGSQMQWTGRQVEYNFTLPVIAAGAAAMKFALDNEAAMVRVEKVYGDGTQSMEEMRHETEALGRAFEALSNQYGVNRAQVIGIAADWAAAGSSGLALAKVTEQTLKTMILGELEAKTATQALIAIQGQYQLSTKELTDTIDVLNMVENQTGISLAGLIDGFARAAGTARAAGVSTRELAAMLSALVPTAGTAAQAGNALKTIFSRLLSPTEEAAEVMGLMGINTADMAWISSSATDRLKIMAKAYKELGDEQNDQLSSQQAVVSSVVASRWQINKFEVLMQDLVNETGRYNTAMRVTADENAVFKQSVRELNAVLDSSPRKFQIIWTMMQNALADVIQPMIPFILSLAGAIATLMQKFSDLNPAVQKLIVAFLAFLAIVGPLLRYMGATAVLVGSLARAFAVAVAPVVWLTTVLWGLVRVPVLAFLSVVTKGMIAFAWVVNSALRAIVFGMQMLPLALRLMGALFFSGLAYMITFIRAWAGTVQLMFGLAWLGIQRIFIAAQVALLGIVRTGLLAITAFTRIWGPGLLALMSITWSAVAAITMGGLGVIPTITAAVLAGAMAVWTLFSRVLLGTVLYEINRGILIAMAWMGRTMTAGMAALRLIWATGWAGLVLIVQPAWLAIQRVVAVGIVAMQGLFTAGWAAIRAAAVAGWASLRALYIAGRASLLAIWASMQAFLLARWAVMWAAMLVIGGNFMSRLRGIYVAILMLTRMFSTALIAALTGPWGAALAIVVILVVAFWDELKVVWKAIVEGTIKAFNALPQGVQNAMMSVVRVVRAAAMAVYNLFSWMNPWAHHSPSLVENVTTGVAEIKAQFSSLGDVGEIFLNAGLDLEEFGKHVRRLQAVADDKAWAELRKELMSIAPDAIPSFDKLVSVLGPLRDLLEEINVELRTQQAVVDALKPGLDAANAAYDEQKNILDQLQNAADAYRSQLDAAKQKMQDFADAPIEGMKAMSDAIFNNTMEQKRLQLQLMQMEDAVGPLDKLQGRLDAINGQMELLQGEQTNLRNAGAGSEILSQYDDQIAALEDQQRAIDEQIKPLQDLSDAIDELGRKGQMLDLEESLKFDPLKRQIDDVANAMNELPFDEILAGVTEQRAEVDRLTEAYEDAQKAVEAQKLIVDQLEAARDALQLNYDLEKAKLDAIKDKYQEVEDRIRSIEQAFRDLGQAASDASGRMSPGAQNFIDSAGGMFADPDGLGAKGREGELMDQSEMIDQFTKDIADKTKNMFGLFDFLDPIKNAWNKAWSWLKTNVGSIFSGVGEEISNGVGGMNPFAKVKEWIQPIINIGHDIADIFGNVWDLIGPSVVDLGKNAWEGLQEAFKTIQPEIEKFRDLMGPTGKMLENIWTVIKPILAVVVALLALVVKALISALAGGIKPFIEGLAALIGGIIRIIRGIIEVIVGVFTGDWKMAWQGVKDIFLGIWDALWGALKGIVLTVLGLIQGLAEGIIDWFKWVWEILFGHSIIPDIVNAFHQWFDDLFKYIDMIWKMIASVIIWVWEKIISPVWDAWKNGFEILKAAAGKVFDWYRGKWEEFVNKLLWARDRVGEGIQWIKDKFWGIIDSISGVWSNLSYYIEVIVGALNGIARRFGFGGMFDGIKWAFREAMNWIIGKWNNMSFGIGDFSVGTPNIDFLARGGVTNGVAVVGEGRAQYPEYVIPTDPNYRKRAVQLFADLGKQLGVGSSKKGALLASIVAGQERGLFGQKVQMLANGGIVGRNLKLRHIGGGGAIIIAPTNKYMTVNFHGDLSFPNVKNGDDAEQFVRNLEALLNEG